MFDLLKAYGDSRSKATFRNHKLPTPLVMSLTDARDRLRRAMRETGLLTDAWTSLSGLLPQSSGAEDEVPQESIKASSLLAGLEMAKDGEIFLRQDAPFSEIFVKATGQESRRKDIEEQG